MIKKFLLILNFFFKFTYQQESFANILNSSGSGFSPDFESSSQGEYDCKQWL